MRRRPLIAMTGWLLCVVSACASTPAPPPATIAPTASSDLTAGVDRVALSGAIDDYIASSIPAGSVGLDNIRAVVVSVDGVTHVERYRGIEAGEYAHVFSVTKSVLSTLVGIAVADGIIDDLDDNLASLLPDYRAQMSTTVASITVEQLLTMTSGIGGGSGSADPLVDAPDYISEVLQVGVEAKPGTEWNYSDRASDVLAAVLTEALKRHDGTNPRTVLDYAREKLFDPLGIKSRPAYEGFEGNEPFSERFEGPGFAWATDRRGRHYGCCMLKLTAPDMVKFGELYLQGGEWRGHRLVPSKWVRQATTAIDLAPYGRMWWTRDVGQYQGFAARGRAGQLVLIVPDLDLVVAVASTLNYDHDLNADELLPLVAEAIIPYVD